jgi:hypothetical protein
MPDFKSCQAKPGDSRRWKLTPIKMLSQSKAGQAHFSLFVDATIDSRERLCLMKSDTKLRKAFEVEKEEEGTRIPNDGA